MLKFLRTETPQVALPQVQYLNQEANLENIVAFIRSRGRASCYDLMTAFKMSYTETVKWMDALENREFVHPCHTRADGVQTAGPRKLRS